MAKYDDDDPPGMIPLPFGCFGGDMYVSTYCMTIHLALLLPGLGFIIVFILWLTNKDRSAAVDRHGKAAVNWVLSFILYTIVIVALITYYRPIDHAFSALMAVYYLFAIIAAAKAYDGKFWPYPLSIPFFR